MTGSLYFDQGGFESLIKTKVFGKSVDLYNFTLRSTKETRQLFIWVCTSEVLDTFLKEYFNISLLFIFIAFSIFLDAVNLYLLVSFESRH